MSKAKVKDDTLKELQAAFSRRQLAKAEIQIAEAEWFKLMTVTMIEHHKNVDTDRICLECGAITRTEDCDCITGGTQ